MEPRPVVNVEEFIGKTVGKRRPPSDPLRLDHSNRSQAEAWMNALPVRLPRRGVYRFHSHEEANQWMNYQTGPKKA
ncbi:MAG: hypothetical protein JNJ83_17965 [Verrucomicrobiaceae bacterium]|nr:hypothetical protein [Verrucomicrobiaceae bacterium]